MIIQKRSSGEQDFTIITNEAIVKSTVEMSVDFPTGRVFEALVKFRLQMLNRSQVIDTVLISSRGACRIEMPWNSGIRKKMLIQQSCE